jgi:DNA polymerase elongation subunit (family B)
MSSNLAKVVFDIETVGLDFDSDFDEVQKEYLLKFAKSDEEINAIKEGLGLYPVTGKIVTIAMYNVDSKKGCVFYDPGKTKTEFLEEEKENIKFIPGDEKTILEGFWEFIQKFEYYITFNGRGFDIPFIRIRSAILGLKCPIELMTPRFKNSYKINPHIDLIEELTFQGAYSKKFNLDFYCKAFGIQTPKTTMTGYEVPKYISEGKGLEVAEYCIRDVIATAELFEKMNNSYRIV